MEAQVGEPFQPRQPEPIVLARVAPHHSITQTSHIGGPNHPGWPNVAVSADFSLGGRLRN